MALAVVVKISSTEI